MWVHILPPFWNRVNWSSKIWGRGAQPPTTCVPRFRLPWDGMHCISQEEMTSTKSFLSKGVNCFFSSCFLGRKKNRWTEINITMGWYQFWRSSLLFLCLYTFTRYLYRIVVCIVHKKVWYIVRIDSNKLNNWKLRNTFVCTNILDIYRKVASSNTSRLEAHTGFFRLLMKTISDRYVPCAQKVDFLIINPH